MANGLRRAAADSWLWSLVALLLWPVWFLGMIVGGFAALIGALSMVGAFGSWHAHLSVVLAYLGVFAVGYIAYLFERYLDGSSEWDRVKPSAVLFRLAGFFQRKGI